ncbi:hypothetical protein [Kaarinaea lacus]
MKKSRIIMVAIAAGLLNSGKLLAFGSVSGLSTPIGGNAGPSPYSFTLNIRIPFDTSLRPNIIVPTTPVIAPSLEFDATQVPVHELPPLPLTLDTQEQAN